MEVLRKCPFKKEIRYFYTGYGNFKEVESSEEKFGNCEGENCMLYHYDPNSDTEFCTLGGNPYI